MYALQDFPVTVASAERSFSKLKIIKTYLRSTMSQDRLNELAILAIENEIAKSLNMSKIIDDFEQKTQEERNVSTKN